MLSLLPNRFSTFEFVPSGAILSSANERSRNRKPLLSRFSSPDMIWYSFCALYCSIPLLFHLIGGKGSALSPVSAGPFLALLECARQFAVPVVYMAFPPTMPVWRELTEMDGRGVRRPRKEERKRERGGDLWVSGWDLVEILIIYQCDWS